MTTYGFIQRNKFTCAIGRLNHILITCFLIWIAVTLYTILLAFQNQQDMISTETVERLSQAQADLSKLRKRNRELFRLVQDFEYIHITINKELFLQNLQKRMYKLNLFNNTITNNTGTKNVPSLEYQTLQKRILNNIKEFWYFISFQVKHVRSNISEQHKKPISDLNHLLSLGQEHTNALLSDMTELIEEDGFGDWREEEANDLANLVAQRIRYLQNPVDCKAAKKIVCSINYDCGYGCQIHHLLSCFMVGYGTKRTVILESKGWSYSTEGWEKTFEPLSETCRTNSDSADEWPGTNDSKVLYIPVDVAINPRPQYIPQAVPEDLAPRLIHLHGNPSAWWTGQVLRYMLRYQKKTADYIETIMQSLRIKNPIVGVHVRRTDKVLAEASFHSIEEYMNEVNEYYNQLELKQNITKRRIYLATDDVTVISEVKTKYPHYEVISNPNKTKTQNMDFSHSSDSLINTILDVHILSLSDFLVCTFSSNICRLAFEIMQTYHADGSTRFRSLDDIYYYSQQLYNRRRVVLAHKSMNEKEIDLEVGDIIHIAGNHWDGYSLGTNLRTTKKGLFPSFKVDVETEVVRFPTYSEMNFDHII